jgi:hypothetical protein
MTAFTYACQHVQFETFELICQKNVIDQIDINAQDLEGKTPLDLLCEQAPKNAKARVMAKKLFALGGELTSSFPEFLKKHIHSLESTDLTCILENAIQRKSHTLAKRLLLIQQDNLSSSTLQKKHPQLIFSEQSFQLSKNSLTFKKK